jgi:BlaI family penicillinase repressor
MDHENLYLPTCYTCSIWTHTMATPIKISEAEWEVMDIVWDSAPVLVQDIVQQLARRKGWHSRTIRTLVDRLHKKGAIRFEADGKRYLYFPRLSRDACVRQESQGFLKRAFGGEPVGMLMHFVQHSELSQKDIQKLKQILSEKEKE